MKILYISSRPPFPKSGGREFMIAQSLDFIAREDLYVICFHKSDEVFDRNRLLLISPGRVLLQKMPSIWNFLKNVISRRSRSLQENLYFSVNTEKRISKVISDIAPDVIVCDMLRTSQYCENFTGRLVIDLDDILSMRYKKMNKGNGEYSVLGSYSERLPNIFNRVEPFLRDLILSFEERKIRQSEERAVERADAIILTSPTEACELNKIYSVSKCIGVPQAIESNKKAQSNVDANNLLFIGNLTTAQNLTSLKFIVQEILPELKKVLPKSKLIVVGKYDYRAENIVEKYPGVRLCGFVDDINVIAEVCFMSLAVVAFGTGIKTKVLEAIALGLPVVTNSVGAEGLAVRDGVELVLADSVKDIVDGIVMLKEKSISERLILNAQKYLKDNHSKSLLRSKYLNALTSRS